MNGKIRTGVLRGICLTAGVVMIAAGIFRGEPGQVMMKAVKVCLECIGIG